ncbi:MAG: DUF3644 domain-containing protein [Tissierellia bacterium]|nr:DUF3644 domain-containing protein [Tissierellia bacterium]
MSENNNGLSKRLVKKSIEAFILGLEIYNKPTIKYRIEGFSFFICNAWELMLKAKLINENKNIYYNNSPDRTLSLNETINKVYTDKYTRIRLNLEKIIDLRNISTHYITEDYEFKYVPLFQACVLNYINELNRFHNEDISNYIAQNFLHITTNYEPLTNEQIKMKYSPEIAEKFIKLGNEIDVLSNEYNSDKFAIPMVQKLYITRKKADADFEVSIDKDSDNKVQIIKQLTDPADTHKYSFNNLVTAVSENLRKNNIVIDNPQGFTNHVLKLFNTFYSAKDNPDFSYCHTIGNNEQFTYSEKYRDFILSEIKKNPDKVVESLKRQ